MILGYCVLIVLRSLGVFDYNTSSDNAGLKFADFVKTLMIYVKFYLASGGHN